MPWSYWLPLPANATLPGSGDGLPIPLAESQPRTGPQRSCRQLTEKFPQLGRRLELRNRIKLFESAGKGVQQAPHGSRRELGILRLEVQPMNLAQQALGSVQLLVNECRVEDQLRLGIGDLGLCRREAPHHSTDSEARRKGQKTAKS
jgi:hypothetical protein